MALTLSQYNDHVYQMLIGAIQLNGDPVLKIVPLAVAYMQLGVDQRLAAVTFLTEVYRQQFGVDPILGGERHRFFHWVEQEVPGSGVLL